MTPNSTTRTVAGLAFMAAALIFLIAEALAAQAFTPSYSYAHNFISELGIPGCWSDPQGVRACSPLSGLMNGGFLVEGPLFILAMALMFSRLSGPSRMVFAALAVIHGAGLVTIGIFHANGAGPKGSSLGFHVLGAMAAIIGGNLAIALSPIGRDLGAPGLLRRFGPAAGVIGLAAVVVLSVEMARRTVILFDLGFWERLSVYTIMVWELVMGAWLAFGGRARRSR